VLVTLANPLPLAIVGNPHKGRHMAKRRKLSAAGRRRSHRTSQLRWRWKQRTRPGGKFAGYKAVVHSKAGRRKKHSKPRGHRWAFSGLKGTVSLFKKGLLVATNPIGATIKQSIVTPITSLPKSLPALFKGSVVKNVGFAAAGGVTGLVGGNIVQGMVLNLANQFLPAGVKSVLANDIAQRVLGASFALLTGGLVAKVALKNSSGKAAFITGTAAAALVEAIFPGRLAGYLMNVPVIGPLMAHHASPVNGLGAIYGSDRLAGYVSSRGYTGVQGMGAYVDASAYQGVNGMGAYVDANAYQGVNGPMDDAIGGNLGYDPNQLAGAGHLGDLGAMGSNMASHLDA
jgi:hypothetical protein